MFILIFFSFFILVYLNLLHSSHDLLLEFQLWQTSGFRLQQHPEVDNDGHFLAGTIGTKNLNCFVIIRYTLVHYMSKICSNLAVWSYQGFCFNMHVQVQNNKSLDPRQCDLCDLGSLNIRNKHQQLFQNHNHSKINNIINTSKKASFLLSSFHHMKIDVNHCGIIVMRMVTKWHQLGQFKFENHFQQNGIIYSFCNKIIY